MKATFRKGFFVFFLSSFALVSAPCFAAVSAEEDEVGDFDRFYLNLSGGMLLPGNGNSLEPAALASVRGGWYLAEDFALELGVLSAPNAGSSAGNEALTGVSFGGLYHLFGYERFDPFVTLGAATLFGARHVFADGSSRTAIGPECGLGAFYHLTEQWSLRADAHALAFLDFPCGMVYSVELGAQRSF